MVMASSSSSDESSKSIPTNFKVSGEYGPLAVNTVNYQSEQDREEFFQTILCPLCCTKQRRFNCRTCVRKGNFIHSGRTKRSHISESLSEKQHEYLSGQASLRTFCKRYEQLIKEQKSKEIIQFQIKQEKEKVRLLQELVFKKREKLKTLIAQRDELQKTNADKSNILRNYPSKVEELENYVLDQKEKTDIRREQHYTFLDRLKGRRRQCIQQLVMHIFPITEIVLKDEVKQIILPANMRSTEPSTGDSETIAALAEAKNTSYIRGKWVFHGSGISEMQYCIVAPSLPANGDYSAYVDFLSDNKDDVPKSAAHDIAPSRVTAYRIIGALTYTSQLMQVMSYYLNVRLPNKLAYGEFCKKQNEDTFLKKVSRLNSNIYYVAYTQRVKLSTLNENHTLENILAILDLEKSDLGRHGYHEVYYAPLSKSIDSLLVGIETESESESEDENSLRLDWEAVTNVSAEQEIVNPNLMPPASQQSTIAEGLITSAASRITSMFRWMKQ